MRKNILCALLIFLGLKSGFSQTGPQFTQYVFNHFYLNPGASGISQKTNIQATVRSQYTGYQADVDKGGSILSSVYSIDMPSKKLQGGIGVYFSQNSFSQVQSEQELLVSYSFHKKISNNILGIGLSGGISNLGLKGNSFRPRDENDPLIPNTNISSFSPTLNIGAYLYNPNYQIGLSVRNLIKPAYSFSETNANFKDREKIFLTGKINIGVSYTLDISPMFIVKSDLVSVSTEIGALANYNQKYWAGLNYRWQDAASILIGGNFLKNNLKMGVALDIVSFAAEAKAVSSQEIFIRYVLNPVRFGKKSIIKTPRYSL